ncbi:MAG: hypothetical protein IMF08_04615, partial [Proteobacteria bacterium]|nr:hypothetical protein [Pseudomonadota bacterium]
MADSKPDKGQRTDWVLVIAIAAIAFLILLSLIWQVTDFIADGRLNFLIPWQTAIAALIGFAGLIVTTIAGFYFANRQRKEDARLARKSREHQAKLDRERDDRLREEEARALAAALAAEFGLIVRELDFYYSQIQTIAKAAPENAKH